jgi:drug/metabolite transporter (DMT)-like permease
LSEQTLPDGNAITSRQRQLTIRGFAAAGTVVVFWSGFNIVSRLGGRSALTVYDLAALRFGIAAIFLLPVFLHNPRAIAFPHLLALALFGGLGYSLFVYAGFSFAPASHAGVLVNGGIPFTTALAASMMLGFRPNRGVLIAYALTALGIALIGYQSLEMSSATGERQWLGDIFFFLAASCWGIFGVLLRKWQLRPFDAMSGLVTVSAVLYLPIYLLFLPKAMALAPMHQIVLQGFYQGVIAAVAAGLLFAYASQTIGPIKAALMLALVPGISSLAAVPLLNEPLTTAIVAGLVCVTAGAALGAIASAPHQPGRE